METGLEADILAASQAMRLPGAGERRILTPVAVERVAAALGTPRWQVEAVALEAEVAPLHYLRNLDQFGSQGQVRLLRASVAAVGSGPALERCLELLALNGVGRIHVIVPDADAEAEAERLAQTARNRNASCAVECRTAALKGGNPAELARGMDAVAACLEDSMEEQLLQFACRMAKAPLALGGVEEARGQATTILPGDPGVALVYKPSHPHLEPSRGGTAVDPKAALMVGAWLAEQTTRVLLGYGDLLRGKLLYADLTSAQMTEYSL